MKSTVEVPIYDYPKLVDAIKELLGVSDADAKKILDDMMRAKKIIPMVGSGIKSIFHADEGDAALDSLANAKRNQLKKEIADLDSRLKQVKG